jgi:hypothetical protein
MKKIDLGQTIGILANLGVIAGIVFLGFELSQNTAQLASQARMNFYELRSGLETDFIRNVGGISDLLAKSRLGELTPLENARLQARNLHILNTFQFMYQENPRSASESAAWMARLFPLTPGLNEAWSRSKDDYDPDFVAFMEESVIAIASR